MFFVLSKILWWAVRPASLLVLMLLIGLLENPQQLLAAIFEIGQEAVIQASGLELIELTLAGIKQRGLVDELTLDVRGDRIVSRPHRVQVLQLLVQGR